LVDFFAAHGLQGLHGFFFAAHGLQGLHGCFFAAQGLQGLQAFLAAQGLHGLQAAANCIIAEAGPPVAACAAGKTLMAPTPASAAIPRTLTDFLNILCCLQNCLVKEE